MRSQFPCGANEYLQETSRWLGSGTACSRNPYVTAIHSLSSIAGEVVFDLVPAARWEREEAVPALADSVGRTALINFGKPKDRRAPEAERFSSYMENAKSPRGSRSALLSKKKGAVPSSFGHPPGRHSWN